jgi:hypothetical protein
MTLLHFDGFDSYQSNADVQTIYAQQSTGFSLTAGRYGGGAITFNGTNVYGVYLGYTFDIPQTDLYVGYAVNVTANNSTGTFAAFTVNQLGATNYPAFGFDPVLKQVYAYYHDNQGSAFANAGINTVLGVSSNNVFTLNTWHFIECHITLGTVGNPNGVMQFWVDGNLVLNITNAVNNPSNFGGSINIFTPSNAPTCSYTMDDIYIQNTSGVTPWNNRLGDSRISLCVPVSDASPNQGTPASGVNHYAMVNQPQGYNPSNYVIMANTIGYEERFGISALPTTPATIWGLSVITVAEKSDGGLAYYTNGVISNGVESDSSVYSLTTGWMARRTIFTVDPYTSTLWNNAAVTNLKINYKVAATP